MLVSKEAQRTTSTRSPLLLTPAKVRKMLERRQRIQVIKFRTTVADCVPNY
jgi:hypothetical protein